MNNQTLLEEAKAVLEKNERKTHTIPADRLYPHQWLWDSCFIAIGLRHFDMERAQKELKSLTRGQWANGMLPHQIFTEGEAHWRDRNIWRSWLNPYAPDHFSTSGITQPPMLAEAVVRIGKKLSKPEMRTWYQTMFPALLAYHEWLYRERDPHREGLVLQVHPWETGLDNTPPWMQEMHDHQLSFWIRMISKLGLDKPLTLLRRDTHYVMPGQRLNTSDALGLYSVQHRLRRKAYDIDKILTHSFFAIEDLTFNCILIRANHHLRSIAKIIDRELPKELLESMRKGEETLEQLWDAYSEQYYPRNFVTHKLIKEPSIGTLMPLYAGSITKERAAQLVKLLHSRKLYGPKYPVPSVPINSPWFKDHGYWQGPTWINTNWLIIDGLERYGFKEEATAVRQASLELVSQSGFYEYFSPLDGSPAGTDNFSWTAALMIDLLS
ncbi:MAG: hypothetical protein JWS12_394 [Candidatus Saccharibacteria bacterium]|nr:hypothetical protein [Candidatus Saccharibacteria bacterium]